MRHLTFKHFVTSHLRKVLNYALDRLVEKYEQHQSSLKDAHNRDYGGHQVFWQDVGRVSPLRKKRNRSSGIVKVLVALAACALLAACVRKPIFPKDREGDDYVRTFHWSYAGRPFRATFNIPVSVYEHYDAVPKNLPYEHYACEDSAYPCMNYVVRVLCDSAEQYGFDEREWTEYLLCFVQAIPYAQDPDGPDDFVRFAPVSVVDAQLDCEDKAILFSTLCSFSGMPSALIDIPSEHHMAAGVQLRGCARGGCEGKGGRVYRFCETTTDDWKIGRNSCPNAPFSVVDIPPVRGPFSRPRKGRHASFNGQTPIVNPKTVTNGNQDDI